MVTCPPWTNNPPEGLSKRTIVAGGEFPAGVSGLQLVAVVAVLVGWQLSGAGAVRGAPLHTPVASRQAGRNHPRSEL